MTGSGASGVAAHARTTPDKVALVAGDDTLTYAAFDAQVNGLAQALCSRGVEPGDRVAVMLPNGVEFFVSGLASARAMARFIPVNWHLKAEELAWILADGQAKVLIAHVSLLEHVRAAADSVRDCQVLLVGCDVGEGSVGEGFEDYATAIANEADAPVLDGWAAPAYMFYTSGTTGRPKGVVHERLDPAAMTQQQNGLAALWGFRPDDIHLLSGPAYHAGPAGYAFTSLTIGATVAILPDWDPRAWLRLVATHRVTTTFMSPAHFIRILEVPDEERATYDLSSLRLIIHAGAPCPRPVKEAILDALAPAEVWELYGASEGGATRISPAEWRQRPGSVGLPWPGTEVRILDADGKALPPGDAGLIYIAPAGGASFRYHGDDAKTEQAWRDGAFTVGDVGHLDEDGYLYITDRATDMVLRGGVNVYPREIEEVLHRHAAVVDCAVFGVPDERLGEELVAVVELRSPVSVEELQAHCRTHLADFKCPRHVRVVDELPRDPNGKVLKRRLREAWA